MVGDSAQSPEPGCMLETCWWGVAAWMEHLQILLHTLYTLWIIPAKKCVQYAEKCDQSVQIILGTRLWHTFHQGDSKVQNWGYQRKQGYKKCVQSFNKYAKSVYKMLKSVPKVCKSYFAHTLGILLIKVIAKWKTGTISVCKDVKSVYMALKSCVQSV